MLKKSINFDKVKRISGKVVRFFAKSFLVLFVVLFIFGCIGGTYLGIKVWPTIEEYKNIAYEKFDEIGPNTFTYLGNTVIYGKDGNIIGQINVGNYQYVEIENVSKWVHLGYISVEDKRFRVHNGIDYKALARAGVSLIKNKGNITQGGSTITQQVLKNNLLTQEKTFKRKLVEFFLAPEFEKKYTKQDIMEFYVNTNFYGNNCYGIETASWYYFGKPSKDLTLSEAATFVGMSNNASFYNPKTNLEGVKNKRNFALGEMYEDGVITEEQYNEALAEELNFLYQREARVKENYQVSYAIYSATLNIMEENGFKFKYLFEDEADYNNYKDHYNSEYNRISEEIRAGGYKIYTTLDSEKQAILQKNLDKTLSRYGEKTSEGKYAFQGAAVLVNNETGYVEAIVGGRGTDDEYNRGFLSKRQPGSSIKPLVAYGPAFDSGLYYPSKVMNDKDDPSDPYFPRNYGGSFHGNMPIREALARSTNTIAYMVLKDLGANRGLEYLEKMRFSSMSDVDNNNTAVALGGFTYGCRVVDMAKGYSTIANMGEYTANNCVMKIEYQNVGTIFEEKSEKVQVYERDAAYMVIDCAKGVLTAPYGTATSRNPYNAICMAKSGTTNDAKDVWFCGSSVYYSMAVWCGYDMPRSTGLTGGAIPAVIWRDSMVELHKDLEKKDFSRPDTVIDLSIDYKGDIAKYSTGAKDMFSKTLLDKAEAEKKALAEKKKIDADNILIAEIRADLSNLRNFIITVSTDGTTLNKSYTSISKKINKVYQESIKKELLDELNSIKSYFAVDIRNMGKIADRNNKIISKQKEIDAENAVVDDLNSFNDYTVTGRESINAVEMTYSALEKQINKLSSNTKRGFYLDKLKTIKSYKEILLKPYREEIEREKEQKKEELKTQIVEKLNSLREIVEYPNNVSVLYSEVEKLFAECKQIGLDYSNYQSEFNDIKKYIESLKPIDVVIPDLSESDEKEDSNSELDNSEDITVSEKPKYDFDEEDVIETEEEEIEIIE